MDNQIQIHMSLHRLNDNLVNNLNNVCLQPFRNLILTSTPAGHGHS